MRQKTSERAHLRRLVEANPTGLTAAELARIVGVERGTVIRWLKSDYPELYAEAYSPLHERFGDGNTKRVTLDLPETPSVDDLERPSKFGPGSLWGGVTLRGW